MRALIIYANYKEQSFTEAVKNEIAEQFHQKNYEVVIRDLYEIKFNPVLTKRDLQSIEQELFPLDIMNEQKFVQWADIICFVFPVWWSGMPAILKGYIERVFTLGYAFTFENGNIVPKLENKKIVIVNTLSSKNIFRNEKHFDALNVITDECIFGTSGMQVVLHEYINAIKNPDDESKKIAFNQVADIVSKITNQIK